MKYLLLQLVFEKLQFVRVQFKASDTNLRSKAAILKIGAQYEGTLRKEGLRDNGSYRDAAYFSILDTEWPRVKQHLQQLLNV